MIRAFVDRLITPEDSSLVMTQINSEAADLEPLAKDEILKDPILFGEYTTDLQEEHKYYEDKGDYNAVKDIFKEVSSYNFN